MSDSGSGHPAVFFDRDGVVNVSPGSGYVTRWDAFHLCPGIAEALQVSNLKGYLAIVVTSQRCVGKGLLSEDELADIHFRMLAELEQIGGIAFDGVYAFTGLPGSEMWEKPRTGMIEAAVADHEIDLSRSWIVGDHDRDITMGVNAGIPNTVRVQSHHPIGVPANHTIGSTAELAGLFDRSLPTIS